MRFTDERMTNELVPIVLREGEELSTRLGYPAE
jgi:hypothetical protein